MYYIIFKHSYYPQSEQCGYHWVPNTVLNLDESALEKKERKKEVEKQTGKGTKMEDIVVSQCDRTLVVAILQPICTSEDKLSSYCLKDKIICLLISASYLIPWFFSLYSRKKKISSIMPLDDDKHVNLGQKYIFCLSYSSNQESNLKQIFIIIVESLYFRIFTCPMLYLELFNKFTNLNSIWCGSLGKSTHLLII